MNNLTKLSSFVIIFASSLYGMEQDRKNALLYKKVYDQHQQQFVKVRSLVDIAADVFVPSQLVPACKQLSGSNIDTFGKNLIDDQFHRLPDELRPLINAKLLLHGADQHWKIGFLKKEKREATILCNKNCICR